MPLGAGRVLKAAQEQPADVWILGTRIVSSIYTRPVVFHKPASSTAFVLKYDGSDVSSGESLSFLRGVRNRRDDRGVIHVHSFYEFSSGRLQNPSWQAKTFARSDDNGESWTYPGLTSATTSVESEEYTSLSGTPVTYTSNDVQMVGGVCSPEPGVIYALAKERVGTQDTIPPVLRRYYEYDLCLLQSVDGGALERIASVAPLARFNTAYNPVTSGAAFFDIDAIYTDPDASNTPRAIYPNQVPPAPSSLVSVEIQSSRGSLSGFTKEYSYATISSGGASVVSGLPYGTPPSGWGAPAAVAWDGQRFYYGNLDSSNVRKLVRSESAAGPWEDVYTGGSGAFAGIAARKPGNLYVSGKGVTTDGGQNWTTVSRTLTRVGFFGSRFYGYSGTTVYTSRDGITWTAVTLPAVTGLNSLVDVFGG